MIPDMKKGDRGLVALARSGGLSLRDRSPGTRSGALICGRGMGGGTLHMRPELHILHEDDALLVVNKPAWSVVHPTRGARGARVLVAELRDLGKPVFPVHRLDRQTSGVLVFARSSADAAELSRQLREGIWRKTYRGVCRGLLEQDVVVDHPVPEKDKRREAVTEVICEERLCGRYSLLLARPRTGRRHQVRYHLKHLSHPLVGDVNYGDGRVNRFFRATFGLGHLFLHAAALTLLHPREDRLLTVEAPLPDDLACVLEKMRAYSGPVV